MSEVTLEHINKTYPNGFQAVKDFNLDIADGEFVIFVGPSGCGKSTTLRMIAGLEDISGGELKIDGQIMNDVEPKDRDIAMVFQNYALYPHMSVKENMEFPLKIAKLPQAEIDQRVAEAAKILDLEKLLDRKPKALSGGQRQRVAMGRAIVRNPKVLLLDEPLSNLDAKLRGQMRVEISRLHERLGATMVYVTHDQTEAMTLGDRIVVMSDGEVQQIDSPQFLYDHPANKFVAGFIGSPQMNFMDATVVAKGGKVYADVAGTLIELTDERGKELIDLGYNGKEVTIGIRPEDLSDDPEDLTANPASTITAKVAVRENLGAEVYLYTDYAGNQLTARVEPTSTAIVGDEIKMVLDKNKIHVFDKATEKSLHTVTAQEMEKYKNI
jgi:multiple sugar transport system ATP-binding protein